MRVRRVRREIRAIKYCLTLLPLLPQLPELFERSEFLTSLRSKDTEIQTVVSRQAPIRVFPLFSFVSYE